MNIFLSVATSADGCVDDTTPARLVLSTPADWSEIYALRARFDAILVGAETIRRDNPSLRIKDDGLRRLRIGMGMPTDIVRVTVTASGDLPADAKFFTGEGRAIVITSSATYTHPTAEVLRIGDISAQTVVGALESAGIGSLFVEGGPRTLGMFLDAGLADTLRVAVNPSITVGDAYAPHFDPTPYVAGRAAERRNLDGMEVSTYRFDDTDVSADDRFMRMAIEYSRRSVPCATAYRVGAVVVTACGEVFAGYTHETTATSHAEQEAVRKALQAGAELRGATIYSSLEPCTSRKSEPESCSQIIIRLGFRRVVFAMREPEFLAHCTGAETLRRHGIRVDIMPRFARAVAEINAHIH